MWTGGAEKGALRTDAGIKKLHCKRREDMREEWVQTGRSSVDGEGESPDR